MHRSHLITHLYIDHPHSDEEMRKYRASLDKEREKKLKERRKHNEEVWAKLEGKEKKERKASRSRSRERIKVRRTSHIFFGHASLVTHSLLSGVDLI